MLDILDTAGVETFSALRDAYMRSGDGFILVCAVDCRDSLEALTPLHEQIVKVQGRSNVPIIIAANKSDLEPDQWQFNSNEGEDLVAQFGGEYVETSAKDNSGINDAFLHLIDMMVMNPHVLPKTEIKKSHGRKKHCGTH